LLVVGYLIRWKGSFLELFLVGFYVFLVLRLKFGLTSTSIVGITPRNMIFLKRKDGKDLEELLTKNSIFNDLSSKPNYDHSAYHLSTNTGTPFHVIIRKLSNSTNGMEIPNGKMQTDWNMDSYLSTKNS
jgi:hypothetical protein